jgi:hypothetical protein
MRHIEIRNFCVSVRLVAAKTRLAPLKTISIPRLELMGAVIGLRLSKQVCTALELPVQDVTFGSTARFLDPWTKSKVQDFRGTSDWRDS